MILTIDKWADQLAGTFNRITDSIFIARLKDLIVQEYATILKQTVEKNGYSKDLITSVYLPLSVVTDKPKGFRKNNILYRTTLGIVKPVRTTLSPDLFTFVGSEDGIVSFVPTTFVNTGFNEFLPLVGDAIYYIYDNSYIYVTTFTPINKIKISAIFSDISLFYEEVTVSIGNFNKASTYQSVIKTNVPLDIPLDIVNLVKYKLLNEELKIEFGLKVDKE